MGIAADVEESGWWVMWVIGAIGLAGAWCVCCVGTAVAVGWWWNRKHKPANDNGVPDGGEERDTLPSPEPAFSQRYTPPSPAALSARGTAIVPMHSVVFDSGIAYRLTSTTAGDA